MGNGKVKILLYINYLLYIIYNYYIFKFNYLIYYKSKVSNHFYFNYSYIKFSVNFK